jgi:hypothetical protein
METHELRLPLQIVAGSEPARLDIDLEAEVQAIWEMETERSGTLFNGRIFNVDAFEPSKIRGFFVEYRWLVAQRHRPSLFERLKVRPLAVSGMIESLDGMIFGRRDQHVSSDVDKWELAPSGGVDARASVARGIVDYMYQFFDELTDEVGIDKADVLDPTAFTLIEDTKTHVFDLGIRARTNLRTAQIVATFMRSTREYSDLRVVPRSAIRQFVDSQGNHVAPVSIALLEACGLLRRG